MTAPQYVMAGPSAVLHRYGRLLSALLIALYACGLAVAIVTQQWFAAAAIIGVPILFLWPVEASMGLYALTMPLDGLLIPGTSDTAISWIAGALAGCVLLVYGVGSGRLQPPPRSVVCWGLFSLWAVSSAAWAQHAEISLQLLSTVLGVFGLYAVAASLRWTEREISSLVGPAIVGGVIAGIVLAFQGAMPQTEDRATLALSDQILNPNQVANGLLLPFVLALGSFCSAKTLPSKAMRLAAIVVIGAGALLTMSRGAVLSMAVAVLLFLFRSGLKVKLLIPLLALGVIISFLPLAFYQRMEQIASDRGTGRIDIFLVGVEVVKHNPLAGVGLGNFPAAYDNFAGAAPHFRGYDRAAHNAYLEVCAEFGAIGLGLLLFCIATQLKSSSRALAHRYSRNYLLISAEAGCYGLITYALFGSIQWRKCFWLGWLLLAVLIQRANASADSEPTNSAVIP